MAKSNNGGAFAFIEGSVGSVTFSTSRYNARGIRRQIARQKVTKVKNPNTIAQILQRMKVAPAQRFYNAINNVDSTLLLEHSWESKKYGTTGRLEFMKRALKQDGPYIPKTATRFVPAEYEVSDGSLTAADVRRSPINGRPYVYTSAIIIKDMLLEIAGGDVNAQVTFLSVKVGADGTYIPQIERYQPADFDIAGASLQANSAMEVVNSILQCKAGYVALAVIISKQDASGAWLRSPSKMVVSESLFGNLYSTQRMNQAVASFQASGGNELGSQWYLNLALDQAFQGKLQATPIQINGADYNVVIGYEIEGAYINDTIFKISGTNDHVVILKSGMLDINDAVTADSAGDVIGPSRVDYWTEDYAIQMGLPMSEELVSAMNASDDEPQP